MHGRGDGGDAKGDVLVGIENLIGSAHDDTLWGDNGVNVLEGRNGNDTLRGLGGADYLLGGAGADILIGGDRSDVMTGARGADVFVYISPWDSLATAPDQIIDFTHADGDLIDLSAIDANADAAGDQAFHWIGNDVAWDASYGAGQLRYESGYVEADLDGDMNADFRIQVTGPLLDSDFVL